MVIISTHFYILKLELRVMFYTEILLQTQLRVKVVNSVQKEGIRNMGKVLKSYWILSGGCSVITLEAYNNDINNMVNQNMSI